MCGRPLNDGRIYLLLLFLLLSAGLLEADPIEQELQEIYSDLSSLLIVQSENWKQQEAQYQHLEKAMSSLEKNLTTVEKNSSQQEARLTSLEKVITSTQTELKRSNEYVTGLEKHLNDIESQLSMERIKNLGLLAGVIAIGLFAVF